MSSSLTALRANGLVKRFKTGRSHIEVLKRVDFDATHGEVTMVMGPSGSGKSTLVASLSGLLKPDEGQVDAMNQDLWKLRSGKLDKFLEPTGRIINIVIRRNDIGIGKSQERRYDFLVRADVLAKSDFQSLIPEIDDGRWQQPVILRGDPENGPVGGDGLRKQASKRKRQAGKTGRV